VHQRRKGKVGEREAAHLVAAYTGWPVQRRVRNALGDSDLVGVPGWSVEVKRHRQATPGLIAAWWSQAVAQASSQARQLLPVLLYRPDRGAWRAVWPMAVSLGVPATGQWLDYEWTVEGAVGAWAALARERALQTEVSESEE
jgi:hypothetical protein